MAYRRQKREIGYRHKMHKKLSLCAIKIQVNVTVRDTAVIFDKLLIRNKQGVSIIIS